MLYKLLCCSNIGIVYRRIVLIKFFILFVDNIIMISSELKMLPGTRETLHCRTENYFRWLQKFWR